MNDIFKDEINAEEIKKNLRLDKPLEIQVFDSIDSTMNEAKRIAQSGSKTNMLLIALEQTSGRGRFYRDYFSSRDGGIYMTLLLHPEELFSDLPLYTVLCAVAVEQAIKKLTGIQTKIKWVNDIYYNKKKIAGILSEAITDSTSGLVTSVSIGIGLNFSIPEEEYPDWLQEKATSLFLTSAENQNHVTRSECIAEISNQFFEGMNTNFIEEYIKQSFVLEKRVSFEKDKRKYSGKAIASTDRGELVVDTENDGLMVLSSGEISLESIE
jgi:BirA family biotin operon repressor/biotin-[acetyl-CoA-carboxylase] ligase